MLIGADKWLERGVGCILDANGSLVVVEDHSNDLGLGQNMEIRVLVAVKLLVEVSRGSILSSALLGNGAHPAFKAIVVVQILQIDNVGPSDLFCRGEEVVFGLGITIRSAADLHRAIETVMLGLAPAVIRLELVRCQLVSLAAYRSCSGDVLHTFFKKG